MTGDSNVYVGRPMERVEDKRFLLGRGIYVDDVQPPDLVHAAILRSSVAHGRIVSVDASAARNMPGVVAVITAADIPSPLPLIPVRMAAAERQERFLQPVIASAKVRYVGEPIAVVIASSRAIAEDAIDIIDVTIEDIPCISNRTESEQPRALLFEEHGTNICADYTTSIGNAEAVFATADYVRREKFSVQRHSAVPMETRGLVAHWDGAMLTVWGAAKVPFFNRAQVASMMGLPNSAVELIELDVGGGFGVRGEFYPEDFLIPFVARLVGRPVKWIEDRREHLMATNHSRDVECELEIACRRDGTIIGLRGTLCADMGAYIRTTGIVIPSRTAQFLPGPYRIPDVEIAVKGVLTNKTPAGSFRGPGRFEANFFRERLMDIAARELGIEPSAFRRRNLIRPEEMPYDYGALVPYDSNTVYDSGDYPAMLDRCLREIGWQEKTHLQGALVEGRYHGFGMACFVESGGSGRENARITVEPDGMITVAVGSSSLGQGIETTFSQIAADALGVPMSAIRVLHGSTSLLAQGFGSFHGRTMIMGAPAVVDAADKLMAAIRERGAERFGCSADAIRMRDGCVVAPDGRTAPFAALATSSAPLVVDGTFVSPHRAYSYGAHAAHVAVDPRTGRVDVLDYVGVEDVGRAINPLIVHGQKIGAIVQGLGGVFLEHFLYDEDGQLLTGSLADYLLPTATDFPQVRAVSVELAPSPTNPLGVKGAGEDGIISAGAVIGNAVGAALAGIGVEPTALPLSPPRLWALIYAAQSGRAA